MPELLAYSRHEIESENWEGLALPTIFASIFLIFVSMPFQVRD